MTDQELKALVEEIQMKSTAAFAKVTADLEEQRTAWKKHYEELKAQGAPGADALKIAENAIRRIDKMEANLQRPGGEVVEEKSVGQLLTESEALRNFAKTRMAKTVSVEFRDRQIVPPGYQFKTTITSATVGSATPGILVPQRIPGIAFEGVRRIRVRDLIPRLSTTNNAIDWVKTNVLTHAASPQTSEGSDKPESAYTFSIDSSPVRTIAHWIPASQQVLDDWDALRGAIDFELLKGLADKEDAQLLTGDGTGVNISGLTTEATAYNTALNVSGDTRLDKLSHALLQLELLNRDADGIVLNPQDWRTITLIKSDIGGANTGEYILGGPAGMAQQFVWGKPVAITTAMTTGAFLVGAFGDGAIVFDRMQARIDVSTEHSDYFIKNLVAIRAEERIALVVKRSDFFVYGTF